MPGRLRFKEREAESDARNWEVKPMENVPSEEKKDERSEMNRVSEALQSVTKYASLCVMGVSEGKRGEKGEGRENIGAM